MSSSFFAAILRASDVCDEETRVGASVPTTSEPARTDDDVRLCWYCCHPWVGAVIPFPVSYDERRDKFKVIGQFCSWECLKAYNRDYYANIRRSINDVNMRHYYKKLTGDTRCFRCAPHRAHLKAFGGTLTIEEFRTMQDPELKYAFSVGNFVPIVRMSENDDRVVDKRKKIGADEAPVDFGNSSYKNDTLKLRRPKPLTHGGRNGLERALGLNSLLKPK